MDKGNSSMRHETNVTRSRKKETATLDDHNAPYFLRQLLPPSLLVVFHRAAHNADIIFEISLTLLSNFARSALIPALVSICRPLELFSHQSYQAVEVVELLESSSCQAVGFVKPLSHQAIQLSSCPAIQPLSHQAIQPLSHPAVQLSSRPVIQPSSC